MKLELKHIQHYPLGENGVKYLTPKHRFKYGEQEQLVCTGFSVNLDELIIEFLRDDDLEFSNTMKWVKLILRPLSDLTKEIEVNGERFVPIDRINEESPISEYYVKETIIGMTLLANHRPGYNVLSPLSPINKLLEWHFDIYELIPNNLAININTI